MAHMIDTMAYANATPWHGLGVAVSNDLNPEQMRQAAGLTWRLIKQPITTTLPDGRVITIPNRAALMRDSDGEIYDIVSDNLYNPVQPEQAFAFFKRFVEAGHIKMETAGSLENGKRLWALASIQDGFTLRGGDRVNGYLLLCSPNVKGQSLEVKFTAVRVVCHNTLTAAMRGKSAFAMAHWHEFNEDMHGRAEEALGIAHQQLAHTAEVAETLSQKRAAHEKVLEYVARLTQPDLLKNIVSGTVAAEESASVLDAVVAETEHAGKPLDPADFNRAGRLILESILESPGSDLPSARGTWWGALNGVTHAVDHKLGRNETRLAQSWFGHRERMKTEAVELALEYANAH